MGKGIFTIDKAFVNEISTMPLPDSFKLVRQREVTHPYRIDFEYESELIPDVVEGAELPYIISSYYQERVDENHSNLYLADLSVFGEFEKGKIETRVIYKREN